MKTVTMLFMTPLAALPMRTTLCALLATILAFSCANRVAADVDLTHAMIVAAPDLARSELNAVRMLREEVAKRSQIRWTSSPQPSDSATSIILGTLEEIRRLSSIDKARLPPAVGLGRPEGYSIWVEAGRASRRIFVAGHDSRGVLFGVGRLLRELQIERQRIALREDFRIDTAPDLPLRGHQLGYRPKTNSYDAWDVAMWEQYLRDLIVFGCNAIELIPPRSDDDADSPHFPLPQMEMMVEMSRLADDYGLDVWIWYPAMDPDYSDSKTVEFALKEWGEVFRKLPRIDAVFVPGGDPGHTQPKYLLQLLAKQTKNLRRLHPEAQMWVSPQSFNRVWMDEFLQLLRSEPPWLTGVVYGPQVRMTIGELRAAVPKRYPIRDYPDITHSRHCQYPVPDWDLAFALTEAREPINPRPTQMAQIFRATTMQHARGFITYSEGCNDDVNKAVWSALGWNTNAGPREILQEYSRCFIGSRCAEKFANGLLGLEQNWSGAVSTNEAIAITFRNFQELEKNATPQEKSNWRFQQALYRAYYDEFVRRRAANELSLENQALAELRRSVSGGRAPKDSVRVAQEVLERAVTQPVAIDLRARLFELGEALFQSIRMQLSVERYAGASGRGNNLDYVDAPLNNREWLKHRFAEIRKLPNESAQRRALAEIVNWTAAGPGGFHDDLGDLLRQPHLLKGVGWERDPGFYATPQIGFNERVFQNQPLPRSWWTSAESLYDAPLKMHYAGLEKSARYRVKVVYGHYRNSTRVRLLANNLQVHSWLQRECEPLEFDVPSAATAGGELTFTWEPEPGHGENGRVLEVAEVWLIKK